MRTGSWCRAIACIGHRHKPGARDWGLGEPVALRGNRPLGIAPFTLNPRIFPVPGLQPQDPIGLALSVGARDQPPPRLRTSAAAVDCRLRPPDPDLLYDSQNAAGMCRP